MFVFVKVAPGSKENKIEKINDNHFLIKVKALPEKGKANEAVLNILAKYFNINKTKIKLVSGKTSKNKLFKIN
ncbi:MAG: DUF167 domain-containing protein [Minisyncoccia bacterium]